MEKSTGRAPQPRCDVLMALRMPAVLRRALKQASSNNSAYLRRALLEKLRADGIDVGSDKEAA
jgi:hypothetical protein